MPARTDHDRRDAQHAARATIAIALGRYIRRITEQAYAHIEEEATRDSDGERDWSAIGASCADQALASFGAGATPQRAIDGDARELAAGEPVDP